ncbi:MAG: TfuA-like protein, partial [Acidobacteriota bacterium]|nr:TfuA-like protein [Acidobacteriota bacterium]
YCPWTYEAVSEPLVNTRYALRSAIRSGLLTRAEAGAILGALKAAWFPERTRLLMLGAARGAVGADRAAGLGDYLAAHPINIKNRDARLLIHDLLSLK